MGLFDSNRQTTNVSTVTQETSTDVSEVLNDSFNKISSTTISDSGNLSISQPVAILANGSDGAGFDPNKFFSDSAASLTKESGAGSVAGNQPKNLWIVLAIVLSVVALFYLRKRKT